jgi:hypothetical protein
MECGRGVFERLYSLERRRAVQMARRIFFLCLFHCECLLQQLRDQLVERAGSRLRQCV